MCSNTASEMALVASESCGLKLLYLVLDSVVIGNLSMFPIVKMPSEYSLHFYL
jgi:hypothetical protein